MTLVLSVIFSSILNANATAFYAENSTPGPPNTALNIYLAKVS